MYNIIFRCFVRTRVKLYSNSVFQPLQYECILKKFKSSVPKYAILTQGYCTKKVMSVHQEFDKKCEEELNQFLKDPENVEKFEKCKLEVEFFRNKYIRVPETLRAHNWLHLLKSEKAGQRRAYLAYLWQIEKKRESRIRKKEKKMEENIEEKIALTEEEREKYVMSYSTLFHRIRSKTIMQFYNARLMNAILYAPEIVIDVGYNEYMTQNELQQCAKQLLFAFSENRIHDDPANLYFCNAAPNNEIMILLHKTLPTLYDIDFPVNVTSKSYLEVFDKSRLVYLTPHTKRVLTHYDHNAVYIIGAMVDKTNHEPLSMQKARREGIKMAKLPLSERLNWGTGSMKTLPVNQVISIMLDLKLTNNWEIALRHIPRRKLQDSRMHQLQRKFLKREELISSLVWKA